MKAANDNDPLPFIQIAATFANVITYLSLKQQKSANDYHIPWRRSIGSLN